ncbi:MAG: patatin-like phospholipase family protein [Calditrichaeota bacterium]|nr:patatin-like phospholipase family protein [Calditrichota bacterium]
MKRKKIGLALSGGAVLGIAHLGVIKALEEKNITFDIIAGTSAGSLVGAFLAAGYTVQQLYSMTKNISWDVLGKVTIPTKGLLNSHALQDFIEKELHNVAIEQLPKPFAAVGVDLTSGKQVVFRSGPVSEAVRASCAIPGVFTPLIRDEKVIVDGGVLNFLPTDVARDMGADYVIGVKLTPSITPNKPPQNIIQILVNSFTLALSQIAEHAPAGDFTITPDLVGLNPHDFKQADDLFERGYQAGLQSADRIADEISKLAIIKKVVQKIKND